MTPSPQDTQSTLDRQAAHDTFRALVQEHVRMAIRATFIDILEEEVRQFVGADRYERTAARRDSRAGYRTRSIGTTAGQIDDLPVPRTRSGFHTQLFDHYQRRMTEVDELMRAMFVGGVSQRTVSTVVEQLTGSSASASTVSRVFHTLEDEFATWQQRRLPKRYVYAFADATYFSVIYEGEGHTMPILALIGIREDGQREVIAFTAGERENQGAWENLLDAIKARGVEQIDVWITDGHQAMLNALALKLPASKRQRCMRHKIENVLSHVPEKQREVVREELRAIFYQSNRTQADQRTAAFIAKYEQHYPSAIACLKRDWASCLTFYDYPEQHGVSIRTSNVIERMFEEVKKRSKKMAAAFRNEGSCLLLFYAVVRALRFRKIRMPG